MPKPYIFETRDELIRKLSSEETIRAARAFFDSRVDTVASAVHDGVGSNTFRAFRNLPVRPSVAFREWTTARLVDSLPRLVSLRSPAEFALFVHETTLALDAYWADHARGEMGYGRGSKLLNLVLKKIACLEAIPDEQRQTLLSRLHVPLDSYTILGLRIIAPSLNIPRSATMKFVTSQEQYRRFQAAISEICEAAGVPPIYYDVLAWDMGH